MRLMTFSSTTIRLAIALLVGAVAMIGVGAATGSTAAVFAILVPLLVVGGVLASFLSDDLSKPHSR